MASNSSIDRPSETISDEKEDDFKLNHQPVEPIVIPDTTNDDDNQPPPQQQQQPILTHTHSAPGRKTSLPTSSSSSQLNNNTSRNHQRSKTMPDPRSQSMKTLFCIRHAESEYNLRVRSFSTWVDPNFWKNGFDPMVRDPHITQTGHSQVSTLSTHLSSENFLSTERIELMLVSPLRRTLQTCMGVFAPHFDRLKEQHEQKQQQATNHFVTPAIPVYALPILREWMDTTGDLGRLRDELEPEFPAVDFSLIERDVWWYPPASPHSGDDVVKESADDVQRRTVEFLEWVSRRPEQNIVVVGHSRFFRLMVGARKKLPNCGMMKVLLDGSKIISWSPWPDS